MAQSVAPPAQPAPPPSRIVAVPQVSQQPAVVPIPTSAINPTGVKPSLPEAQAESVGAARQRLLVALNDGRAAAGELREAQLQPGDQIYSDGGTLAVVRLEGLRRSLYWLAGPVDLQRVQYSPQGNGRYQVTGSIDPEAPPAHRSEAGRMVAARVPAANDATRLKLERQYNDGQSIAATLRARQLQPEDRLLVDGDAVLVVRREGNQMARYWLDGAIDLGQTGVRKIGGNLYQVTGSVR
jgi:urease accessory protein UreE